MWVVYSWREWLVSIVSSESLISLLPAGGAFRGMKTVPLSSLHLSLLMTWVFLY